MLSISNSRKAITCSVLVMVLSFAICSMAFAEDFETPHEFSEGDVISADMMNEVFDYIRNAKNAIVSSDLVGTWTCIQTTICGGYAGGIDGSLAGVSCDTDNLLQSRSDTVTFTDDNDNTYSFQTSTYQFFERGDDTPNDPESGTYTVLNDIIVFNNGLNKTPFNITKISNTKYKISFISTSGGAFNCIICDKQNLPPAIPTSLSVTSSGLTVTLSWTDKSDDETGFKVMSKDSLEGSYSQVVTADEDATTYNYTVTEAGDYWYRVKATNSNGDSLGSNVVKVTVSE